MKQESLEALLIDRAAGELSPETAELLDEYIAAHPEAATAAEDFEQTLDCARDYATRDLAPVPPMPLAPWKRATVVGCFHRWWPQIAGLAACLALGMLIGWGGQSRWSRGEMESQIDAQASLATQTARPVASHLWSLKRIAEASLSQPSPAARKTYRINWDSRSLKPRVEEKQ